MKLVDACRNRWNQLKENMKFTSWAKTNIGVFLISSTLTTVVCVGAFEIFENIQYYRWKADFNNYGWFDTLTIPSSNPVLMWEYRPYGNINQIKTNRHGFRDRDYESMTKPENVYRIAFIGDSITLGFGVSAEETFVHQFENIANGSKSPRVVQALNFGVDGYNTLQVYELLRTKALSFNPDKIVYMVCLNDFDFEDSAGMKIRYFQKPKSFLLTAIERALQNLRREEFHLHHFQKNKETVFRKILDMKGLTGEKEFQVVILPVFPVDDPHFKYYWLHQMHTEIGQFLAQKAIPYVDLLPAFQEQGNPPAFYAADVWHPNAEGSSFIAQKLLAPLLSH